MSNESAPGADCASLRQIEAPPRCHGGKQASIEIDVAGQVGLVNSDLSADEDVVAIWSP